MEILDWLNKNASAVNVLVLVTYAVFTLGIWRETRRSARLTEALARQSDEALTLQLVMWLYQAEEGIRDRLRRFQGGVKKGSEEIRSMRQRYKEAFPPRWGRIELLLVKSLEDLMR